MSQIVHTSNEAVVTVTAFHTALFDVMKTGLNAKTLMVKKVAALVVSKYAKTMPTFEQYANDQKALTKIATDKGLSESNEWYQRWFRESVITLYGAAPVSMDKGARDKYLGRLDDGKKAVYDKALSEAIAENKPEPVATALAVQAAKKSAKQVVQATAGAPKGEKKDQAPSEDERIEQLITSLGMFKTIDAIVRILRANEETADKAKALNSLRNGLARIIKPAEVKSA